MIVTIPNTNVGTDTHTVPPVTVTVTSQCCSVIGHGQSSHPPISAALWGEGS